MKYLLAFFIAMAPFGAFAAPPQDLRAIIVADLTAARDDAAARQDVSQQCWDMLIVRIQALPPRIMGVAHGAQLLRDLRHDLPKVQDNCAVVKDGARQAILQAFGNVAGAAAVLAQFGL